MLYNRPGVRKRIHTPPADGGPVGIRDVAKLANVSPATVSRVLNGATTVNQENRERVLDAIRASSYRPNQLARNLRRQQSEMIGVVVSDIENPHFSESVRVIEDAAYSAGYRVLLANSDETSSKQRSYLEMLAAERVIGVVISPADSAGAGTEALFGVGIPVVCFDRKIDDPRADAVVCENVDGLRRATEHLIYLGHSRIAYLGGRLDVETGIERLEGYNAAMRAAGLTPFSLTGSFRVEGAEEAMQQLLLTDPRPTAIVVANNLMTIGVLRVLRAHNLQIPKDIAIVSVDDPVWAEFVDPPLTTLAQPVRAMADAAMAMLMERIAGRTEPHTVVLPFSLRVRASCGMQVARG
jgi:LacI family transcriptional regulator